MSSYRSVLGILSNPLSYDKAPANLESKVQHLEGITLTVKEDDRDEFLKELFSCHAGDTLFPEMKFSAFELLADKLDIVIH